MNGIGEGDWEEREQPTPELSKPHSSPGVISNATYPQDAAAKHESARPFSFSFCFRHRFREERKAQIKKKN